eukprot:TRINITY_DN1448_c0_g3_i2.p1 TRINITY_DN1448_c0_g3~~TRINITY_DN1448_c0_g3_i2.p1  ORF type:complete len:330 (+),score=29.32 TRINITY_DN1448_c0_g3_i2:110-1099(+)
MSEIEEDIIEWTKYRQARYFHKLAHQDLVKLDENPLFGHLFDKLKKEKGLSKYKSNLNETSYSSMKSPESNASKETKNRETVGKASSRSMHKAAIKKSKTAQPMSLYCSSKEHSDRVQGVQTARGKVPESFAKSIQEAARRRNPMTPTASHRLNAKQNLTLKTDKTLSIKSGLNFHTARLKTHKIPATSEGFLYSNRGKKIVAKTKTRPKVEVKSKYASLNNTCSLNCSKTSNGEAVKSFVLQGSKLQMKKSVIAKNKKENAKSSKKASTGKTTPRSLKTKESQAIRLRQPKQKIFKGVAKTNGAKLNVSTILNINELVQRFDEFVWKI